MLGAPGAKQPQRRWQGSGSGEEQLARVANQFCNRAALSSTAVSFRGTA